MSNIKSGDTTIIMHCGQQYIMGYNSKKLINTLEWKKQTIFGEFEEPKPTEYDVIYTMIDGTYSGATYADGIIPSSRSFTFSSAVTSIYITDSITSIGARAYLNAKNLTSVTIADSVTAIYANVFDGCSKLKTVSIGSGVTTIGGAAFKNCSGLTEITLPSGLTSIGESTFQGCSSLTSITIPDGVTSIGAYAFSRCESLTSITIPDSVTSIGEEGKISGIFEYCYNLQNATIGNGVTNLYSQAFYDCTSLTSVTLGTSISGVAYTAFGNCTSLTSITCNSTAPQLIYGEFYNIALEGTLTYPEGADYSIWYAALPSGWLGNKALLTLSSEGQFYNEIYSAVTFDDGVIPMGKFKQTDATSVKIGNGITTIGISAFHSCSSLSSVTIGNGVTSIGNQTFYACTELNSITSNATTAPTIQDDTFVNCGHMGSTLYHPSGSDYSQWMSTELYYLGLYGWIEETF